MADFDKPQMSDTYTEILTDIRASINSTITLLSEGGDTNLPLNAVRFLNNQFYTYNGSSFDPAPISVAGGGTGGSSSAEARASLGVLEAGTGSTQARNNSENDARYLIKSNSLSDVTDPSTARSNLGLGSLATQNEGTAGSQFRDNDANDARFGIVQSANLGTSGDLTSGSCKVCRVGDLVTISGSFSHASSVTASSATGYIPSWARPDNYFNNAYAYYNFSGLIFGYTVRSTASGQLIFDYNINRSVTDSFTISYVV